MKSIEVTLPTGFAVENRWYRSAWLHSLNGADEEAIREVAQALFPVERITLLLTRCLTNLGPKSAIDSDDVRALTVGDRDALLLHLRRVTYGERIQSVLTCPQTECREKMDLELTIGDILVPPNEHAKKLYEVVIRENGNAYNVQFRLPTGADQEAAAKFARHDPDAASKLLLQRCIQGITKDGTTMKIENGLSVPVAEAVSKRMAELDPQAEILLNLTCPACKQNFLANFDIGDYFFKEFMSHSHELYDEVHVLALHYHWSERDILSMPRSKRQRYLKLLADTLNPGEKR